MENYLEEFHSQKDEFSPFCGSKSTKMVSEAFKKQLTLDKQEEWVSDPTWNNISVAAKSHRIDEDKTQIKSGITQHLVNEQDFNLVKIYFLNHFSEHIHHHGNLVNARSGLAQKAMRDLEQPYQQSNCHEAAVQISETNPRKEVFQS